jgi:hypothetical protein
MMKTLVLTMFATLMVSGFLSCKAGPSQQAEKEAAPADQMMICTDEFAVMYNPKTKECQDARDGCQISAMVNKGWRRSTEAECPSK